MHVGDYCRAQLTTLKHNLKTVMQFDDCVTVDEEPMNVMERGLNGVEALVLTPCWGNIGYSSAQEGDYVMRLHFGLFNPYEILSNLVPQRCRIEVAVCLMMQRNESLKLITILVPWNFEFGEFERYVEQGGLLTVHPWDLHIDCPRKIPNNILHRQLKGQYDFVQESSEGIKYGKYRGTDRYVFVTRKVGIFTPPTMNVQQTGTVMMGALNQANVHKRERRGIKNRVKDDKKIVGVKHKYENHDGNTSNVYQNPDTGEFMYLDDDNLWQQILDDEEWYEWEEWNAYKDLEEWNAYQNSEEERLKLEEWTADRDRNIDYEEQADDDLDKEQVQHEMDARNDSEDCSGPWVRVGRRAAGRH